MDCRRSGADRRIVLVEDNPDDVALTKRAFGKAGIANEVVVIGDGAEALDLLPELCGDLAELPGLILLDLNLPRIGGIEVLRAIKASERTQVVPVVILTSSSDQQDVLECYRHGANGYVRKPVKPADFSDAISAIGHYWLRLNELAAPL